MKIAVVQFAPSFGEKEKNLAAVERLLDDVRADLVILPELFASGYLFLSAEELAGLAEPIPGPVTERLTALARKNNFWIVAGVAESVCGKRSIYNSAVLVGPQGGPSVYRKAHLFGREKKLFEPGDTPFAVHDIGSARIGILVCFDHLFPEAARTLALKGAQVICHPANLVLPGLGREVARIRAVENRIFFATANRFGVERRGGVEIGFTGESQIVNPKGEVLVRAPARGAAVHIVEIDPAEADDKQITAENDIFGDRRTDLYEL